MSIEKRLQIVLLITCISGVVSILTIAQISRGAQLHHINLQYHKMVSDFSNALNYPESHAPSIQHMLGKLYEIEKQTTLCLNIFGPFNKIVMRLIKAEQIPQLCRLNHDNVNDAITYLEKLIDLNKADLVLKESTRDYLIDMPELFERHSAQLDTLIEKKIATITELAQWFIVPFFILVIVLIYTIIRNVTHNAIELRETARALEKSEVKNNQLAFYDSLTNLPNRELLTDKLQQTIEMSKRHKNKFAILFLDLDRFKNINDTLGHAAGDKLIQQAADRIKSNIRGSDTLCRFGGDEFVIILPELRNSLDASMIAKKIIHDISRPFHIHDTDSYVTVSIGITIYPENGADSSELLKNADIAMYQSKGNGKNNFSYYNNEINEVCHKRSLLERNLRKGIDNNELFLHYQPVVDLESGGIAGVEALLRWQNEEHGMVSPAEFIPIAEDTGLIIDIGHQVIDMACKQCQIWRTTSAPSLHVAINVSARQLRDNSLVEHLEQSLLKYNLPCSAVDIEITESTFYTDDSNCIKNLHKLDELGVRLLLDDFGTEYSSLSTLHSLPFDIIKIDRSFLKLDSGKNKQITGTIIDMAENFEMQVVAEGIETLSSVDFIRRRGCKYGQGFLFKKPLPADDLDLDENFYSVFEQAQQQNFNIKKIKIAQS